MDMNIFNEITLICTLIKAIFFKTKKARGVREDKSSQLCWQRGPKPTRQGHSSQLGCYQIRHFFLYYNLFDHFF